MGFDQFVQLIAALGTVASAAVGFWAIRVSKTALAVSERSIAVAERTASTQTTLTQRQLLLPLWEHLTALQIIDPMNAAPLVVIRNVNTLELVALLWEGGMIDGDVLLSAFGDAFVHHYRLIEACRSIEGLGKNGPALLGENPAARRMYRALTRERKS